MRGMETVRHGSAKHFHKLHAERIKKKRIKVAIKDAAKDPLFLADIREIEKDFEYVDFEEAENYKWA